MSDAHYTLDIAVAAQFDIIEPFPGDLIVVNCDPPRLALVISQTSESIMLFGEPIHPVDVLASDLKSNRTFFCLDAFGDDDINDFFGEHSKNAK